MKLTVFSFLNMTMTFMFTGSKALAFAGRRPSWLRPVASTLRPLRAFSTRPAPATSTIPLQMIIDGRNGINGATNTTTHSGTALQYANSVEVAPPPTLKTSVKKEASSTSEKPKDLRKKHKKEKPAFYPHRQELLSKLSMLPKVTHAKGSFLYLEDGTPVLDCLAQYGAVPLGHNNQEINQAIVDHLTSDQAVFIQPFMPETTKELSRKLCDLANQGLPEDCTNVYDFVAFSNSGAETVEAAFKLARTKTMRSKILSATDSFHGKSFAALSATGSDRYSNEYIVCDKNFHKVPFNDIDALTLALTSKEYAAFIVEPVQGEGGMVPANKEYLKKAQELCAMTGTKLIFDEIQTGLGRTGSMFAKDAYDVQPDILLLSKALGGGSYPIGAMITKRSAYSKEFDRKHSSTFAAGGVAAAVALKTLELMETTDVLSNVCQQAKQIEIGLTRLQYKFPEVFSFNGKGLMWALDFQDPEQDKVCNSQSTIIMNTAISYIICGFLLNEKQLLCMPFLGKPSSIRFEPTLTMDQAQVSYFLNAIEDVCTILKNQRHDVLLSYLIQRPSWDANIQERFVQKHLINPPQPPHKEGEKRRKFAFLAHNLGVDDTIKQLPPAVMAYWNEKDKKTLSKWILSVGGLDPEPTVAQEITMTSATGETVTGMLVVVSCSPADMMKMNKQEKQELMEAYHRVAKENGADHIIGLGAFTSVITRGGTQFVNTDEQVYTSGNSFTAMASAESLKHHASYRGNMGDMGVTVIGGKGSVGRLALMELLQHFGHVNIVGNPKSGVEAMEKVVGDCLVELIVDGYGESCNPSSSLGQMVKLLRKSHTHPVEGGCAVVEHLRELAARHNMALPMTITTDATTCVDSTDYVLTATSEGKPFLSSDTFLPGTVIFDLARPFDFVPSPECCIEVIEGGLATMPEETMWGDTNIAHKPPGTNLACLSETIALAMEGVERSYSLGSRIPFSEAKEVYNICIKQGFAPLYSHKNEINDGHPPSIDTQLAA